MYKQLNKKHPIAVHLVLFSLWGFVFGVISFLIDQEANYFCIFISAFSFLGWLLESYYRLSAKKLWVIYFLTLFVFLIVTDRKAWVDWTSTIIQLGLAAFIATLSILFYNNERRNKN